MNFNVFIKKNASDKYYDEYTKGFADKQRAKHEELKSQYKPISAGGIKVDNSKLKSVLDDIKREKRNKNILDGAVTLAGTAALAYGAKKLYDRHKRNKQKKQEGAA